MRENADQNNFKYGHFSRSECQLKTIIKREMENYVKKIRYSRMMGVIYPLMICWGLINPLGGFLQSETISGQIPHFYLQPYVKNFT